MERYKVLKKQKNSRICFVCGLKNNSGIKAQFYETEGDYVVSIFNIKEDLQSYPGRAHGGVSSAILDETIGRAIMIGSEELWGVTVELNVKYKKPIPLGENIVAIGKITKNTSRIFEGVGEIRLSNGEVAVTASGKYIKMNIDKIANFDNEHEEWKVVMNSDDPEYFEF